MSVLDQVRPDEADVAALLERHFNLMREQSPPESCHVLPANALDHPDIHLYALRYEGSAVAVGAIKAQGAAGELKSMHTAIEARGHGYGRILLVGLLEQARTLGLSRLELETGSGREHLAARNLYASEGFSECPPFGEYTHDPLSTFMAREI
ncbi:MAG: GNAT family N-acetyltransferase [Roseobacter sp.]